MRWSVILVIALAVIVGALPGGGSSTLAFQGESTPSATPSLTATTAPTATPQPTATPVPPTPTSAAPTLIPPTPLPTVTPSVVETVNVSGVAYAQENGALRVGAYYNAAPFVWLNEYGEVTGYEAEIVRAIAIELGIEVEFVQVTRQNALDTLLRGHVDLLIGQQVQTRDRESDLDYTHPVYINQERMVVQEGSPWTTLLQMAGQPVSVEMGSRSERVLQQWMADTGITYDVRPAMSEGEALDMLAAGEVAGMVGELESLRRAGRQQMRLIDEPVANEVYALAMRDGDVNLGNLLNRSIQRLKASGRLDQMFAEWFPGETIDFTALVPVYENLYEDTRGLNEFNADVPVLSETVLQRLSNGQPLRVAGLLTGEQESAPAQVRLLNNLNTALVNEMARRWGVDIQIVPNSALNAVDVVANGGADLAVGISPRWDGADRAAYSLPYAQHVDQLLARQNEMWPRIETGFGDLLGTGWVIGYFADDAPDKDLIQKWADYFGVGQNIRMFEITREDRAIYTMVIEKNLHAIYGDNMRLLALMQDSQYNIEDYIKLLPTPYGDVVAISFATPRGDTGLNALVNFTLQDMARDGTYQRLWTEQFGVDEPVYVPYWGATNPDGE